MEFKCFLQRKNFRLGVLGLLLILLPIIIIASQNHFSLLGKANDLPVYNVKEYGVKGDGVTDDTVAINTLQASLASSGGILYFPAGTYLIGQNGIIFRKSNVVFRGEGRDVTILRRNGTSGNIFVTSPSFSGLSNISLEHMTLDRNGRSVPGYQPTVVLYSVQLIGAHVSDVKFWDSPSANLALSGMDGVVVENSVFAGRGDAIGSGVSLNNGAKNITLRGNTFQYLADGVVVATGNGQYQSTGIELDGNTFDLGWWLLKEKMSGEGQSVSYTNTSITDTATDFTPLFPLATNTVSYNVRVMPLRSQGDGQFTETTLLDQAAQFVTNGVIKGELVRVGNSFGVVDRVVSETELGIEKWIDNQEYTVVQPPTNGENYKVYGVYIGKLSQLYVTSTPTTLKTQRWHDLNGNTATPVNGTRYEVMIKRPNYPFHAEIGTSGTIVKNNIFLRGWSDQISHYGTNATVTGNTVRDGQDVGITIHGANNTVSGNTISHQGSEGIWTFGDDNTFSGNIISDMTYENYVNTISLGCIVIEGGERNLIEGNSCKRTKATNPLGRYGYVIYGVNYSGDARFGDAVDNILRNNTSDQHETADIMIFARNGAVARGTVLENNSGSVVDNGVGTIIISPTPISPTNTPTLTPAPTLTPTPTVIPPTVTPLTLTSTPTLTPTRTPMPIIDSVPPKVSITSPLNNSYIIPSYRWAGGRIISKTISIKASATDPSGIQKVEFYVNNAQICTDMVAYYSCTWTVPVGSSVKYQIQAKAYDKKNNSALSSIITVTTR